MKICVLGGHGFIGSNLSEILEKKGHVVTRLSRRNGCDLLDVGSVQEEFARIQPDAIFNCAAHVGSIHYVTANAAAIAHDNIQMATNLYKVASEFCPHVLIVNPLSNCSYPGDAHIHYEPDWLKGEPHQSVFAYANAKRFIYVLSRCYRS